MTTPKKDPAAVALGRRGGQAGTPAQQRARAATSRARPAPTGRHRWALTLPVDDDLRQRVTAAQEASGETLGEWVARALRERLER